MAPLTLLAIALPLFASLPTTNAAIWFGRYSVTGPSETITGPNDVTASNLGTGSFRIAARLFGKDPTTYNAILNDARGGNAADKATSLKTAIQDTVVSSVLEAAPRRQDYVHIAYQKGPVARWKYYAEDRAQGASNPSTGFKKSEGQCDADWIGPFLPAKNIALISNNTIIKVSCKNACGAWTAQSGKSINKDFAFAPPFFRGDEGMGTDDITSVTTIVGNQVDAMAQVSATAAYFKVFDAGRGIVVSRCRLSLFTNATLNQPCPDYIDGNDDCNSSNDNYM